MLTGEKPSAGSTPIAVVAKHLHDPLPPVLSKRPDLPKAVARLIDWMTAKQRDARPGSYDELTAEVQRLSAGDVSVPASPAPPSRLPLAASGALVILLSAFWWFQTRPLVTTPQAQAAAVSDRRLTIAVTPFYGPDTESEREGRVMAELVERSIASRALRKPGFVVSPRHAMALVEETTMEPSAVMLAAAGWLSVALALVIIVAFAAVPPAAPSRRRLQERRTIVERAGEILLPGVRDYHRGTPLLGALQLFAFWFVLPVAVFASTGSHHVGSPGFFSGMAVPNVFSGFPFPNRGYVYDGIRWTWDTWTMLFAHPYANVFWSVFAILGVGVAILHVRTLAALWRERQQSRAVPFTALEVEPPSGV